MRNHSLYVKKSSDRILSVNQMWARKYVTIGNKKHVTDYRLIKKPNELNVCTRTTTCELMVILIKYLRNMIAFLRVRFQFSHY